MTIYITSDVEYKHLTLILILLEFFSLEPETSSSLPWPKPFLALVPYPP